MNVLSRSIFKDLVLTFVLGVVSLNFLLVTESVIRLTKRLADVGLSPRDMVSVLLYLQPLFTVLTVPMALFFSILIVYGRMDADSEIVIMRSSGMSYFRIVAPAFILGVLCLAAALASSFWVAPSGARMLREKVTDIIALRAPNAIQEGIFNNMFNSMVIYARDRTDSGTLKGVFIYDGRRQDRPTVVYASEGRVKSEGRDSIVMDLKQGNVSLFGQKSATDITFDSYSLRVPIRAFQATKTHDEMTPSQMLAASSALDGDSRVALLLEFNKRLTFPFLCIVLMVLAPPLSMMAGKTGRLSGLALGFLVIASYYILLVYTEEMVRVERVPLFIGAWLPAFILLAVALKMFYREARR